MELTSYIPSVVAATAGAVVEVEVRCDGDCDFDFGFGSGSGVIRGRRSDRGKRGWIGWEIRRLDPRIKHQSINNY